MARTRTAALTALLLLVAAGCGWTQWGNGPEHQGVAGFTGATPASIGTWVAHRVTPTPPSTPVVVAAGLAFHVVDGRLQALDAATDGVVWVADLPAGITEGSVPAVWGSGADATVFVEVSQPTATVLLGFDVTGVRNCNPVTRTCRPVVTAPIAGGPVPLAPVLVVGDRVVADAPAALVAFDARGTASCGVLGDTAVCSPLWSAGVGTTASMVGPTASGDTVYAVGTTAGSTALHALDVATGAERWHATLGAPAGATPSIGDDGRVFVPVAGGIQAFAGTGCGAPTCAPEFVLVQRASDPDGTFLSTPTVAAGNVYATASTGVLSMWPAAGCGVALCAPARAAVVHAPGGGSTGYRQTPVVADGILYVLGQRAVAGLDHAVLVADRATTLAELHTWDLGASSFGPGLTNVSTAGARVYAPVGNGLHAIAPAPVQPLAALSISPLAVTPAFDPSITDYAMRCATGTNTVTVTMRAVAGGTVRLIGPVVTAPVAAQTRSVAVGVDQAVVVEAADAQGRTNQYWIRCLPPDFPTITATPHPGAGVATPGWYVLGNTVVPTGVQRFAMILDTHGTPVWYERAGANVQNVTPLAPNQVAFMPTATFAFGTDPAGRYDVYDLLTRSTTPASTIETVGTPTDLHELQTLPNGDHLMLSYPLLRGVDLTGLPGAPDAGPNSTIADCMVQEVNPRGGLVWQWRASDHFDPLTENTTPAPTPVGSEIAYDVFHCNSIDPNPNGNLLVSARNMNAVFEIRRSDGKVLWKMGGTPVNRDGATILSFPGDPDHGIVQQHDARYLPDGHVSVYDNRATEPARAVEFALDLGARTATPVFTFAQPAAQASCCMGSFRAEPDGHRVIGWGFVPADGRAITELSAAGADVLDVAFPAGSASYRAVKVPSNFYDLSTLRLTAGT